MAEGADPPEIKGLVDRSGELKRELVAFAGSKRFDRSRIPELMKAAEPGDDAPPAHGSDRWVQAMDDFIMTFRFPDGTGVIDRFLAESRGNRGSGGSGGRGSGDGRGSGGGRGGRGLRKSDRTLLEGWRDPVDGVFELRGKSDDEITLFNLIDELEYRTYSSKGFARLTASTGDFVLARLVPLTPGAWIISGSVSQFPREHARVVAELALEWLQTRPRLAFRNPEKARKGWEAMRAERDQFAEVFGGDQVVLPPREAVDRLNVYYRARQEKTLAEKYPDGDIPETVNTSEPFFTLREEELQAMDTIGVIFDETDGMSLLPDFGTLEELFGDPSLAGEERYKDALLSYLNLESVYPNPLRRLARAYPDTVDEVYRKILKKPSFTWDKNGEQLLRKRKPWYFKEPRIPQTTPSSDYILELLSGQA